MMTILCVGVLYTSHEEVSNDAIDTAQNITLIAQRNISRNIEILSLSLDSLAYRYQHPLFKQLSSRQQHAYLFDATSTLKYVAALAVIDADGKLVITSRAVIQPLDKSNQGYFTEQRDHENTGTYISQPSRVKLASGEDVVLMSKRLSKPDGSFAGVVVMALELGYFRDLFSGLALGEDAAMTMYSLDGIVYMRLPYAPDLIGRNISQNPVFLQVKSMMPRDNGSFFARSSYDGIKRLYTFRQIPGTQLLLFVGRSEGNIYRHWNDTLYVIIALILLFIAAYLFLLRSLRQELKKRLEAENKLHLQARMDSLTSLLNRRALDDLLRDLWNRSTRDTSGSAQFSILFIDVDYFKLYNDTYGHQQGDDVLVAVAACIDAQLPRRADVAARYGGEEFIAVLAQTNLHGALVAAERIRSAIAALNLPHTRSQTGHVTASIGAATYEVGLHPDIEAVLNEADRALYKAKRNGRNRVESVASKAQ